MNECTTNKNECDPLHCRYVVQLLLDAQKMGVKFHDFEVNLPCGDRLVTFTKYAIDDIFGIKEEEKEVVHQSYTPRTRRAWFDMDDHDFDWQDIQDYYDGY